ncbi:MAG: hypothetical protein U0570_15890 [Phycisphaerales bacterium]
MLKAVPLALLVLPLAACSGVSAPKLTVVDVHQDEQEPTGRRLIVQVQVENLSNEQLPLRNANYVFRLDGKEIFTGLRSPESTLRKWGVQTLNFPVAIPDDRWPGAGTPLKYDVTGSVVYLPPGKFNEILYDYGLLRPTASFRGTGEINLHGPGAAPISSTPAPPAPPASPAEPAQGG